LCTDPRSYDDDEVITMQASVGEKVVIHGRTVGSPDRHGEIREVKDPGGGPPYLVRFDDGHTALVYPGPDCTIGD
jgi:hypothetical protein